MALVRLDFPPVEHAVQRVAVRVRIACGARAFCVCDCIDCDVSNNSKQRIDLTRRVHVRDAARTVVVDEAALLLDGSERPVALLHLLEFWGLVDSVLMLQQVSRINQSIDRDCPTPAEAPGTRQRQHTHADIPWAGCRARSRHARPRACACYLYTHGFGEWTTRRRQSSIEWANRYIQRIPLLAATRMHQSKHVLDAARRHPLLRRPAAERGRREGPRPARQPLAPRQHDLGSRIRRPPCPADLACLLRGGGYRRLS